MFMQTDTRAKVKTPQSEVFIQNSSVSQCLCRKVTDTRAKVKTPQSEVFYHLLLCSIFFLIVLVLGFCTITWINVCVVRGISWIHESIFVENVQFIKVGKLLSTACWSSVVLVDVLPFLFTLLCCPGIAHTGHSSRYLFPYRTFRTHIAKLVIQCSSECDEGLHFRFWPSLITWIVP